MLYCTSLYPADTVKSAYQTTYDPNVKLNDIIRNIYKTSGIRGLYIFALFNYKINSITNLLIPFLGYYKGIGPTMIKAFPANAAIFLSYEMSSKFLYSSIFT